MLDWRNINIVHYVPARLFHKEKTNGHKMLFPSSRTNVFMLFAYQLGGDISSNSK